MRKAERDAPTAEIERQLLAVLCAPGFDRDTRAAILAGLATHVFADPDHEVIFGVLVKIPHATAEHIRSTLSARLTRLGFPDIDVEPIFEFSPPPAEKIKSLLQRLSR
jgi:hypothetical protein